MNTRSYALLAGLIGTSALTPAAALAQDDAETTSPVETIQVRGEFIPDSKRVTSEVSSFLTIDDIATTGDADIATALGRVTGLSVNEGRFVIVRGLDERYSNTLINGSPLASPEPFRRAVPLDLFPTGLISNILVQKTFSPQYPGEFGGGLVQIETAALPPERFLTVSFGASANTATHFSDGLLHDGSDTDWLGYDDGTRDWPGEYKDLVESTDINDIDDPVARAEIGRGLENSSLWLVQEGEIGPDADFSFSAGDRYDFNRFSIGVLAAGGYDNSWETRVGNRGKARVTGDGLDLRTEFDRVNTDNVIDANGLLNVGIEAGDHSIQGLVLNLRSTEKSTQVLEGRDDDRNADIRIDSTAFYERQVYTFQASGEHLFDFIGDGLSVDWRVATSDATRNAPNQREATYEDDDPSEDGVLYRLLPGSDGNAITFSRVDEITDDYGIDLSLPITLFGLDWEWNAGASTVERERFAQVRDFAFTGSIPADLQRSRIDYIYADQNILDSRFVLQEFGGLLTPEGYRAGLAVNGYYASTDVELGPYLRLSAGARYEDSLQFLDTYSVPNDGDTSPTETILQEDYLLPAATLTWTFADNLQARFGYSQTITRPQFRELGFTQFVDTETDELFRGNPYLVDTEIENFDARVEWYFGRNQFFTAGVFHKRLDNPVVEYILPEGETLSTSFINAPEAELTGFELEYEQDFNFGDRLDGEFWDNADFFVKANYTYTDSEMGVEDGEIVITATPAGGEARPSENNATGYISDGQQLQGQSEHLANLQIGWDDENAGTRTALLVNYTSERSRALQNLAVGLPEVREQLPITLDFVHSRDFDVWGSEPVSVRFAIRNILGEDYEATQTAGDSEVVVDRYETGTAFSLSITKTF